MKKIVHSVKIIHNDNAFTQIEIVHFDNETDEKNEDLSKEGAEEERKSSMSKMK
jgi:hypothetical protein